MPAMRITHAGGMFLCAKNGELLHNSITAGMIGSKICQDDSNQGKRGEENEEQSGIHDRIE